MSTSWRDILPVHPAADLFPMMTPDEITALGEDIKHNGLKQPIVLIKTPGGDALLDGRNRLDAMASVGLTTDVALIQHRVLDADTDAFAFVISANIYRRHLTADQRRDLIAKVLKATPDASNRQIAAQVKADDKTVAKVRKVLEATADIPQLKKTTGKDGKARTTAPKKPAPPPSAAPLPEPTSAPEDDFPEMPAFLLRGKLAEPKPYDPRTNFDLDRLRIEAEELQKIVQNVISSEYDDAYSSAAEYVVASLRGYDADVFLPLILAALGEPADPWPNLTRADIKRMTKGRAREAKHRRLLVGWDSEPNLLEKLAAAASREWLEASRPTRAAGRNDTASIGEAA
jgi:ParB-like nuclease domain